MLWLVWVDAPGSWWQSPYGGGTSCSASGRFNSGNVAPQIIQALGAVRWNWRDDDFEAKSVTSQLTRHARMLLIRAGLSEDEADQVLDRLQQELGAGKSSSEHERMEVVERELAQIKARLDDIQRKQPGKLKKSPRRR